MVSEKFDLAAFLPYLLNHAAETTSLGFQSEYKDRYGMLRTEWRVLFHLGMYGSLTAREIGQRANIHKTKISRAVQRLEEKRYLVRKRDAQDRRVEHLTLTQAGLAAFADLSSTAERYDAALTDGLSQGDVETLRRMLVKIAARGHRAL